MKMPEQCYNCRYRDHRKPLNVPIPGDEPYCDYTPRGSDFWKYLDRGYPCVNQRADKSKRGEYDVRTKEL